MLVWGDVDTHIPLTEGLKLRDAIPGSRLIVFRNCGHLPPTEHPEKFVEVVTDFCTARQNKAQKTQPLEFKRRDA